MIVKVRYLLSLILSLFFLVCGTSFFMTFITVRMQDDGLNEWYIGGMHSFFYAGLFLGAYLVGHGLRVIGHIRAFAAMAGLISASMLLMGLTASLPVWFLARFAMGFCLGGHYVIIESWMLAISSVLDRGRILAIYMLALYISQGISQFTMDFVEMNSSQAFMVCALSVSLSIIPLSITRKSQPIVCEDDHFSLRMLFKASPYGVIGCMISGMLISCLYGFTPSFALDESLSVSTSMAVTILGGVLFQWPLGKLSDHIDRRLVLLFLGIFLSIPSILLLFGHGSAIFDLILLFLIGGTIFAIYPVAIAQVCDQLGDVDFTRATGMLMIIYGFGSIIGPLIVPALMQNAESLGLIYYYILISVVLAVSGIIVLMVQDPVKPEEKEEFIARSNIPPVV